MKKQVTVVFRLNAMGDILLTLPALQALNQRGDEVHLVINKRWTPLASFLPAKVHYYEGMRNLLPLVASLRALKPDKVYDLQGKAATIFMRNLLGASSVNKYKKRRFAEQLQALRGEFPVLLQDNTPVWKKYALVCEVEPSSNVLLELSPEYLEECRKLIKTVGLKEKEFIFVHPDASKEGKTIPEKLLSELPEKIDLPLAIMGTSRHSIEAADKYIDCRNKFSLYHLPGVLSLALALITSDSGPMHLARVVNTPLVALFFQTDVSLGFAPITSENAKIISKSLPCKPCSLHGQNKKCPLGHFDCKNIAVDEVLQALNLLF